MQTLRNMFIEPTAHHLCDSGGIYGRKYQLNAQRDLPKEPQATLCVDHGYPDVRVNTLRHIEACLEEDKLCRQFNSLVCDSWDSDFYGCSADQQAWLEDRCFEPEGEAVNTYNYETNFDQIVQYQRFERDGEAYVLLQIHGGADVRSGYTDAKLFKMQQWQGDYFLDDRCSFTLARPLAEAAGYVSPEPKWDDTDYVVIDVYGSQVRIYDHNSSDEHEIPTNFWENLPQGLKLEGVQDAIEH